MDNEIISTGFVYRYKVWIYQEERWGNWKYYYSKSSGTPRVYLSRKRIVTQRDQYENHPHYKCVDYLDGSFEVQNTNNHKIFKKYLEEVIEVEVCTKVK